MAKLFDGGQAVEVDPFVQRLLSLTLDLYPLARPALGWIDGFYTNETTTLEVKKTRLRTISWANFFGPSYVAKYGRDFLLGIPGHLAHVLPDGGVFHQLAPTFLVADAAAARSLRQAVKSYFAASGLKVTCQAPYVRGQVFGREEKAAAIPDPVYGTVQEFTEGLRQLLATTLVLQDHTRVKMLSLDWASLPGEHRQVGLAVVRQAIEAELSDQPAARVRFELSQIPPDLRAVLDELRRTNPGLSYARVDG